MTPHLREVECQSQNQLYIKISTNAIANTIFTLQLSCKFVSMKGVLKHGKKKTTNRLE